MSFIDIFLTFAFSIFSPFHYFFVLQFIHVHPSPNSKNEILAAISIIFIRFSLKNLKLNVLL